MAQTIAPRTPISDELEDARELLEQAFAERDRARERYEASIGTECELGAYLRFRQAGERVAAYRPYEGTA